MSSVKRVPGISLLASARFGKNSAPLLGRVSLSAHCRPLLRHAVCVHCVAQPKRYAVRIYCLVGQSHHRAFPVNLTARQHSSPEADFTSLIRHGTSAGPVPCRLRSGSHRRRKRQASGQSGSACVANQVVVIVMGIRLVIVSDGPAVPAIIAFWEYRSKSRLGMFDMRARDLNQSSPQLADPHRAAHHSRR